MKTTVHKQTRRQTSMLVRLTPVAASLCAGMAVAGEPGKDYKPAEAKAEKTIEEAVGNEPAKARPAESWTSGTSTSDPSPKGGAAPTPTSPHDPAATDTAAGTKTAQPVSDETLDEVVEAAADDSGQPQAPKESWTRGKSAVESGDEERPGDR